MADDPRVQQLLDELLDSGATPEAVCSSCVELLPVVRDRWRQVCRARAELDALFPPAAGTGAGTPAAAEPGTPLPAVPGYEVEAVLGAGGMGVVFRARHLRLNRVVALKMALAGAYAGAPERERFRREAEAVAALRHPNVVQVYDVGDADGRPYFTMEYVEGGSLDAKLGGIPLPAREGAALAATLAGAVEAAHRAGVVHRDLKPANVLLAADGTPKVGDFGLARRLGGGAGLTRTGTAVGTPSYMAPEQALGYPDAAGPTADVYSLGAILYELLTGRPPFRAETAAETVHQLLTRDPAPPSRLNARVPRDLETVCLKCLRKEPQLRYAAAGALADDLGRFLRGECIAARPEGAAARLARRVRRRPVLSGSVALATLSTLALLGGGAWTLSERAATSRAADADRVAVERAADEDLAEMDAALRKSAWPEARTALERARGRLGRSLSADRSRRVDQGARDLRMVAALEEIRLRLSDAPTSPVPLSPERLYAAAFRDYGIDLLATGPDAAAVEVRDSAIGGTLLAFLHDWLYWVSDADRAQVQRAVERADGDEWRRGYREAIAAGDRNPQRMLALAAAPEAAEQPSVILSGLCGSLLIHAHRAEALAVLGGALRRHPGDFWLNYLLGHFWDQDRPQWAAGYFRAAVAVRPGSDQAHARLGRALLASGDADGALAAFRTAFALNPTVHVLKGDLTKLLAARGGLEEVRAAWGKLLAGSPPDPQAGYGYAQLCLFLGNAGAYRQARAALLDSAGTPPADWTGAERSSLACLLLPASGEELRRAVELAGRAASAGPKPPHPDSAYVQFVQGLAEYRQGRPERAIDYLEESAEKLTNRPGPLLVLAMARFRAGSPGEARKTLARAIISYNWSAARADRATAWVSHVLRREAEATILPDLPAFLDGKYLPRDSDERLALLGVCQFTNRPRALAGLYSDAFAGDPSLVADVRAGHRYNAARAAALAGCGRGTDASPDGGERAKWRSQARAWLGADLAAWGKAMDGRPAAACDGVRQTLTEWRADPDLAGLRDPAELAKLPAGERKDCLALWAEVESLLMRTAEGR